MFNPIPTGGGHFVPRRSEMVCHFHRVWARFTKIHDFVPFNVWQEPVKPFLEFFLEIFEKLNIENFRGSSSMSRKSEKFKKIFFFCKNSFFFGLKLNCRCSQHYFEVYISSVAQNFQFWLFLAWKFSILTFVIRQPVVA